MEANHQLVVALSVAGKLRVLEHIVGAEDAEWIKGRHASIASAAEEAGQTWVLEIVDPTGEIPLVCMSNDPTEVEVRRSPDNIEAWLDRIQP